MSRTTFVLLVLTFASALAHSAFAQSDEHPPVFDRRSYAEAKAAATEANKWFIVKATAVWCGPCKQMDRTTWRDEKVVAWLEKNAVVVQLDVDKEKKLAKELDIQAMPTMVAFKGGKTEFDRVVGYKAPAEFLAWLEGVAKGQKSIEAVESRAAKQPKGGQDEIDARYDLARSLMQTRQYEKATDEYAWLWEHSLGVPGYGGVRGSFMASDIQRLADVYPGAKERFLKTRDAKTAAIAGEKVKAQDLDDWVVLNDIVGEPNKTLEWFDKVKSEPRFAPLLDRISFRLEKLLIENDRWADIGHLYPDPAGRLDRDEQLLRLTAGRELPDGMDAAQRKMMEDMPHRMFRDKVSHLYAGLLAAGRNEVAVKYAARAREIDGSPSLDRALVGTALQAGQPRKEQMEWLKDKESEPLLARLRKELEKAGHK